MKISSEDTINYLQFVDYTHNEAKQIEQLEDRPPKQQ